MPPPHKRISSSTAAIFGGGNDDILTEILVLVPPKSVIRLRAVSKHLRSLIDEKSFRHWHYVNHRRHLLPQHHFILRTTATTAAQTTFICDLTAKKLLPLRLESMLSYTHVKVLQSSHGLLLLECRRTLRADKNIYIYNPLTAQRRALRRLPRDESSRFCLNYYDRSKSEQYYTVLCFSFRDGIDIYDSRTHVWEMSKGASDETLQRSLAISAVLCNDRIYFIRSPPSSYFIPPLPPSMCFSLDDLKVSAIAAKTPTFHPAPRQKKYVVESNGILHYLVLSMRTNRNRLDVYEMVGEECWVISKRAESERPLSATFGAGKIEVLGFVRGERGEEEEEDSILVYHVPGKIMVYRFRDSVSEEIGCLSKTPCYELQFVFKHSSYHFIPSFASV